ncbi:MAG: DEAD/DEAH box helicase [Candidatus Omnitrophica bacterium]|nr:DEAD/DEAH box helicase [Candidatus Omnitrophota bacterium]
MIEEEKMEIFKSLGLSAEMLKVLEKKGFEAPTPIQEKCIPALLKGDRDIIAQAQTGTGKTAAFGIPILERMSEKLRNVQVLILAPTRELAIQVAEEINSLKGKRKFNVVPIYGGQSISLQLRQLRKGVDIVVGTPGRVLDHLKRGTLKIDKISYMVLDEADEMLNMGFLEEVGAILKQTPENKRTMLFSATIPDEILKIAKTYMPDYDVIKIKKAQMTVSTVDQIYFEVHKNDKFETLCRIVDIEEEFYGLVFCKTKVDVDSVAHQLQERGYDADALHGDMSQNSRERILSKFKKKTITILVATDVAARGLDVNDLTHVINYALPHDPESYVHRIGRTGRAGKTGNAVTFITPSEYRKLQVITKRTKADIKKAKLPKIQDIIKTKQLRIKTKLENIIKTSPLEKYREMSLDLLKDNSPEDTLAALLQHSFQDDLDVNNYTEIEDAVVDMKGKTRLFVPRGKGDGLTTKKLIEIINEKCKISPEKIRDVLILDKFSFITLPFNEAEIVLSFFKRGKTRGKTQELVFVKAKKDKNR